MARFTVTASIDEANALSVFQAHGAEIDAREQVLPGLCTGVGQGAINVLESGDVGADNWLQVEGEVRRL